MVGRDGHEVALANGVPTPSIDDSVAVGMSNLEPSSTAEVWLMSDPQQIGRTTVDAGGSLSGGYTFPRFTESGNHRLVIHSRSSAGDDVVVTAGITVNAPGTSGSASSLVLLLFVVFAILLVAVVGLRIRRRA